MKLITPLLLFMLTVTVYARIRNMDFTIWTDPKYISVKYNKIRTKGDVIFNATFNQTIDIILRLNTRLTILIADSPDSEYYNKVFFDSSIDFCRIQIMMKTNVFIKAIMTNIFSCIDKNFFRCPIKKGITKYLNCRESGFFFPLGPQDTTDCKIKVVLASTGKLKNNKWVKLNRFELVAVNIGRSKI